MINIKSIVSQNFKNKNCLLRLDLNIPLSDKNGSNNDISIIKYYIKYNELDTNIPNNICNTCSI